MQFDFGDFARKFWVCELDLDGVVLFDLIDQHRIIDGFGPLQKLCLSFVLTGPGDAHIVAKRIDDLGHLLLRHGVGMRRNRCAHGFDVPEIFIQGSFLRFVELANLRAG